MKNILVFAAFPDDKLLGVGGAVRKLANEGVMVRADIMAEGVRSLGKVYGTNVRIRMVEVFMLRMECFRKSVGGRLANGIIRYFGHNCQMMIA